MEKLSLAIFSLFRCFLFFSVSLLRILSSAVPVAYAGSLCPSYKFTSFNFCQKCLDFVQMQFASPEFNNVHNLQITNHSFKYKLVWW